MPRINPHVGLFAALSALMVALFGWLHSDMNALRAGQNALVERVARVEARVEAGQNALMERMARLEAGQDKLVERVARIEGRIEGVLAFARGSAFVEPGRPPRESAPSR